jgi:hypothetical protein
VKKPFVYVIERAFFKKRTLDVRKWVPVDCAPTQVLAERCEQDWRETGLTTRIVKYHREES